MVETHVLLVLYSDCGSENAECHSGCFVKMFFFSFFFLSPQGSGWHLKAAGANPNSTLWKRDYLGHRYLPQRKHPSQDIFQKPLHPCAHLQK